MSYFNRNKKNMLEHEWKLPAYLKWFKLHALSKIFSAVSKSLLPKALGTYVPNLVKKSLAVCCICKILGSDKMWSSPLVALNSKSSCIKTAPTDDNRIWKYDISAVGSESIFTAEIKE